MESAILMSSEKNIMKMGIIGYGNMGYWHSIDKITEVKELVINGVWDIKESAREKARNKGLHVYNSLEDLLADDEISFVLIATDNDVHAPIAIQAMRAGKHVVCEKPITLSSELLEEMIAVSKETGKLLTVHQNRRWDKDYHTVKKLIEDGTLGEVFRLESRVHGSRGISDTWRRIKEKGGGVTYDWGVHLFDQIMLLKKGITLKSIYATYQKITTANVEDGFTALLKFSDNTLALVEVQTSDFISAPRWYVFGTNGTAVINDWEANGKIIKATGKDETDIVPLITDSGFTRMMAPRRDDTISEIPLPQVNPDIRDFYRNVVTVIKGEADTLITFDEMRTVIKIIEAVFTSFETGKAVECNIEM